jgi:hypothetical protein
MRSVPILAMVAVLAGCAVPAPQQWRADGPACVAMFQEYDRRLRLFPDASIWRPGRTVDPWVEAQGTRLREAGCLTNTAQITDLDSPAATSVVESGPAIRPIALHAGAVLSMEDDARVRAFFEARGVPARSIGDPMLGRRIYLGPFATQGGLDAAADLARSIGFIGPYPTIF